MTRQAMTKAELVRIVRAAREADPGAVVEVISGAVTVRVLPNTKVTLDPFDMVEMKR